MNHDNINAERKQFATSNYISRILAHTINCEDKKTSYFCPAKGARNGKCLDGPSFLCDLNSDCDNGEDESETYCGITIYN